MYQRAGNGSGGCGIAVEDYTMTANSSKSIIMRDGAYFDMRDGTYNFYSYVKGYIKNGIHYPLCAFTGYTVTYDTTTNQLTITYSPSAATGHLYFIKTD